jgi:hypothetical protein
MNEQYQTTLRLKASPLAWPTTFSLTHVAACAQDTLGAVVTAHRVSMVACLPEPTLAATCGKISGWRIGMKRHSRQATS